MTRVLPFALGAIALALPAHADTAAAGLDGTFASISCEVRPQPNPDGRSSPPTPDRAATSRCNGWISRGRLKS